MRKPSSSPPKRPAAKFLEDVRNLCLNQLEYLDKIGRGEGLRPRSLPPSRQA